MWSTVASVVMSVCAAPQVQREAPDGLRAGEPVLSQTMRAATHHAPPLFVRNVGQFATPALYVAEFPNMLVRVERGALLLQLFRDGNPRQGVLLRMTFEGASPLHEVVGVHQQPVVFSYFRGADPERWQRDVGAFGEVRFEDLYDGVDLVLREEGGVPKYDLLLERAADVSKLIVRVEGASGLVLAPDGGLRIETTAGPLAHPEGRTWQVQADGEKRWTRGRYRKLDAERFGFELNGVDPALPTVIDPGLIWSTYVGSSGFDIADCVDIDTEGNVVIAGTYNWPDFPVTPGAYSVVGAQWNDLFVTKLRASDGSLAYSAVLGGSGGQETPQAVKFGPAGRVTVAGWADSPDFPTTPGAYDRILGGWSMWDAFVLRLNPSGSDLEYSTFLGNDASDSALALALAPSGAAVVAGYSGMSTATAPSDYPTTPGAYWSPPSNQPYSLLGFITRLSPDGASLEWSTMFGTHVKITAITLHPSGDVLVGGFSSTPQYFPVTPGALLQIPPGTSDQNAFAARLRGDGTTLMWGALFGGFKNEDVTGIALDSAGDVYVCGFTASIDFPTTPGAYRTHMVLPQQNYDGFVARIDSTGSTLKYSTRVGEGGDDYARALAVDPSGMVTVAGVSNSYLVTTPGAFDHVVVTDEAFIVRLTPDGARSIYTTFVGGPTSDSAWDMAMNATGRVAIAGATAGGYPTTAGSSAPNYAGGTRDAFATAIELHPDGVEPLGASTPSCLGPLQMQVSSMPAAGATRFQFLCSAAPPHTDGWLLVSSAQAPVGATRGGAAIHVDWNALTHRVPVRSNGKGYVEHSLPSLLAAQGSRHYVQYVFPTDCGASTAWTASNALRITVQ